MPKLRLTAVALTLAAALSGCTPPWMNGSSDDEPATSPEHTELAPVSGCRVPEAELYNVARAVIGTLVVTRPGREGDVDRVDVNICKVTDSRATGTVTTFGHRDDSIRDTRHELVLDKLVAQGWVVTSDLTTQRCQPNRGHQDFSPYPCV